jgi:acyl-homoserine-lactone acylase
MSIKPMVRFKRFTSKWALCMLALAACDLEHDAGPAERVELRYTEYGIAHVRAQEYRALGFGQGYAQARDNLCKIELGMLGFKGQLSRHFGPDAPANAMAMSAPTSQISDLYFRGIVDSRIVEDLVAKPAPLGPRDEVRQLVRGYADGFNAFLDEGPAVECAGAEWLEPMTEMDVYRRVYAVTTLMDQTARFSAGIVTAEAPVASSEARRESGGYEAAMALARARVDSMALPGSNAVALGGDTTESGGGINLANPHLSWSMDMRWSVAQLTIPGKLNVSGAALIGLPLVVMGHTASVSWSITTAEKTRHHTLYELTLADDSATTYLVDGKAEAMEPRVVSIEVKRPDGALEQVTHTQWWTRYGPVLGAGSGLPLPWSAGGAGEPGRAYAVADVNRTNMRMLNTLFAFNHARSSRDILSAIRENQGVPWWTVVAADAEGQALLSQIQVVPNVPDAMLERCSTDLGRALFASERFAVLDGSRGDCGFQTDADAVEPGIFGPGDDRHPRMPFMLTRDYVENANDSHWLPSANGRISGMPLLLGAEGTEQRLRTRGLIAEIEEQKTKAPYTRQILADAMLSNRSYAGDLVLDQAVALCRAVPDGKAQSSSGESVDVRAACDVLAGWNHAMDVDSRGALLFSRFWVKAFEMSTEAEVALWKVPFDLADPVNTPNTLDGENPFIARALADSVEELERAAIPLDAALGDHQYVVRRGKHIPIGGGTDQLGVINSMTMALDAPDESPYGSGYMHVVAFDGTACPDAVTLLSYSQSSDATSPHHADQTELYSQKRWVRDRFCESAIQASPVLEVIQIHTRSGGSE